MPTAAVPATSHEYTVTLRFCGADTGIFPDPIPANPDITMKCNSAQISTGDELADFSSAQDMVALNRLIKSNPSIQLGGPLKIPTNFLSEYQSNGPLVQVTITADNKTDGAGANATWTFQGITTGPDMSLLSNPDTFDLTVSAYGESLTLVQNGL